MCRTSQAKQACRAEVRYTAGRSLQCRTDTTTSKIGRVEDAVVMQVIPTLLVAEVLMVLLGAKTNDSVELAVTALKEAGALLQDTEPQMLRM